MTLFPKFPIEGCLPTKPAKPAKVTDYEPELSNLINFSREKALDEIRKVNDILNAEYPPGSIQWAAKHAPALTRHARAAENAVDGAFHSEDIQALVDGLVWYLEAYRAIFRAFPYPDLS